jgi:hypothetical protein
MRLACQKESLERDGDKDFPAGQTHPYLDDAGSWFSRSQPAAAQPGIKPESVVTPLAVPYTEPKPAAPSCMNLFCPPTPNAG